MNTLSGLNSGDTVDHTSNIFRLSDNTFIQDIVLIFVGVSRQRPSWLLFQVDSLLLFEVVLQRFVEEVVAESVGSSMGGGVQSPEDRFLIVFKLNEVGDLLVVLKSVEDA